MKKLTASIFTVLLATVGAANAEIASKAYVDQQDTASVTTANTYTDSKIGTYTGAAAGSETVAAAIAAAVSAGVDNAVTHTGAVGNATTPVYVTAEGVATAGTALGTMAYEAAADYSKTGADTTYAKQSDFTTLQSAVNNETTGLAATKAIADANKSAIENATTGLAATKAIADAALPKATYDSQVGTVSSANMGTTASTVVTAIKEVHDSVAALGDTYATDAELSTALADYTPTDDLGALATLDEVGSAQITNGSVATEDIADHAVTLAKVPALSSDCQANGAECVLKSASGALAWEVIKRADNGQ